MTGALAARQQRAAVLVVALVMLLALTLLAVSNMRGVILESRITANREATESLQSLAEAALREAELRLQQSRYGSAELEPRQAHCTKANKLSSSINTPLCLLQPMTDAQLADFMQQPMGFFKDHQTHYAALTGEQTLSASNTATLAWMPYRGLDPQESHYFQPSAGQTAFWNIYPLMLNAQDNAAVNPEYGAALAGRGSYYFLVTGQANDQLALQSTVAVHYLGLNN